MPNVNYLQRSSFYLYYFFPTYDYKNLFEEEQIIFHLKFGQIVKVIGGGTNIYECYVYSVYI